jgi:tRNA A37 threonylcarbamoyladenosine synthetase subunit TsaC/SUA5/YrdC
MTAVFSKNRPRLLTTQRSRKMAVAIPAHHEVAPALQELANPIRP